MADVGGVAGDRLRTIIERIERAEWIHPMQTVAKSDPNDPVRITVDYSRGINPWLKPMVYPTPRADNIFNKVRDN